MRTLWMAKSATRKDSMGDRVISVCYASNEIQAQSTFVQWLSADKLAEGFYCHDTQCVEDSPEARLLFAIFGDES